MKKLLLILPLLLLSKVDARRMRLDVFDPRMVHTLFIGSKDTALLEELSSRHRRKNEECLEVSIILDGIHYPSVGIREKGLHSNDFAWTPKKPLKVVMNEFAEIKHQGIERFNLANSFEDPSLLRDMLSLQCLRRLGLAAPRASHARVYFNTQYHGLYTVIEQVNKDFLLRSFAESSGNLFKGVGGCLDNLSETKGKYFELKTNKSEKDRSRLQAFIRLVKEANDAEFKDSIETYLNVAPFLKYMAFDFIAGNTDSYIWGRCHNFYLYQKENDQFEWIPWDYNLSFGYDLKGQSSTALPYTELESQHLLLQRIFALSEYRAEFKADCLEVLDLLNSKEIKDFIKQQHEKIAPWVGADSNAFYPYEIFKGSLKGKSIHSGLNSDIPSLLKFVKEQKKRYEKELKQS